MERWVLLLYYWSIAGGIMALLILKQQRWRFSLRSLLALSTLIALWFGYYAAVLKNF